MPHPMPANTDFIVQPPRELSRWVSQFELEELPVLASTADELEMLRAAEDTVDAHLLAETIAVDPLMTLKLLGHVAKLRRGRGGSDTETVLEALVMLGISPFFAAFGPQPTVQACLAEHPQALQGSSG